MNKYIYFNNESNVVMYFNTINKLKNKYFNICNKNYIESGQAETFFYDEMKKDGYLIIDHYFGRIDFFIEENKINNIFDSLRNKEKKNDNEFLESIRNIKREKQILKILKNKLLIK